MWFRSVLLSLLLTFLATGAYGQSSSQASDPLKNRLCGVWGLERSESNNPWFREAKIEEPPELQIRLTITCEESTLRQKWESLRPGGKIVVRENLFHLDGRGEENGVGKVSDKTKTKFSKDKIVSKGANYRDVNGSRHYSEFTEESRVGSDNKLTITRTYSMDLYIDGRNSFSWGTAPKYTYIFELVK